jgi:hypothetical protein
MLDHFQVPLGGELILVKDFYISNLLRVTQLMLVSYE